MVQQPHGSSGIGTGKSAGWWLLGAGLGLAWIFRKEWFRFLSSSADIELKPLGKDKAGIYDQTQCVTVKKNNHLTWTIDNQSGIDVKVTIKGWSDGKGKEKRPAVDPDRDSEDKDEPPQEKNDLERLVPAGKKRKIRGRARPPADGLEHEYVYYVTYLNDEPGEDPIVKLIL
jgi:hypothetical protein